MGWTSVPQNNRLSGCCYLVCAINYIQEYQLTRAGPQFTESTFFLLYELVIEPTTKEAHASLSTFLLFSTLLYFLQCLETRKAERISLPPGLHTHTLSVSFISKGKAAAETTIWLRRVKRAPRQAALIQVGYLSAKCTYFFSKLELLKIMIIFINDHIDGF